MIGRVKGCLNKNCSEYHKRYYNASDIYCVKCGGKLSFVCKERGCFKQLPDDCNDKYCQYHLAEKKDEHEKNGKNVVKVGGSVVGLTILGKFIKDFIKK